MNHIAESFLEYYAENSGLNIITWYKKFNGFQQKPYEFWQTRIFYIRQSS